MFRFTPTVLTMAALLAMFVTAEAVEAAQPRSPVERRLRPGSGFWDSSPSRTRSYSSNRSLFRPAPQRYQAPQQYAAPQRIYPAPQRFYATPQPRVVPQNVVPPNVVPQQSVVREQRPVPQPRTWTEPVRTAPQSMISQPVRPQGVPVR